MRPMLKPRSFSACVYKPRGLIRFARYDATFARGFSLAK